MPQSAFAHRSELIDLMGGSGLMGGFTFKIFERYTTFFGRHF